jgi:hypothetical protein
VPALPSHPSDHAVVAGAAAGILSWIFPAYAHPLSVAAEEAAWSRVAAGAAFPSDARAGLSLGRAVAQRVIEAQWLNAQRNLDSPPTDARIPCEARSCGFPHVLNRAFCALTRAQSPPAVVTELFPLRELQRCCLVASRV